METVCAECFGDWDRVKNICPKCDEDTFEWTWAITTSEVRRFGMSFGRVDRKEWEKGLDKKLLRKRNKELINASYFLDMVDFLQVGIPEDQVWRYKYHWRKKEDE